MCVGVGRVGAHRTLYVCVCVHMHRTHLFIGSPVCLLVYMCRAGLRAQDCMCVYVLCIVCVHRTWCECVCVCQSICLSIGLCTGPCARVCMYVYRWVCVHRNLCVSVCASPCGLVWEQALGSLQGWEARRQEGHSSGSPLTKTWRAGPSFLPPFPGSGHSNLAPQA